MEDKELPETDGLEVTPGIFLIGNPTPRPDLGEDKMVCLANVNGALCTVEIKVTRKQLADKKDKD